MLSVSIFILCILLVYWYNIYIKRFEDIEKLPGPTTFRLLMELYASSRSTGIVNYFVSLNAKYGPIVKIWIKPFKPRIITTDMEFCNKIYKANNHHITPTFSEVKFFGERIATNPDYDTWKSDKQIIKKAITREYISSKLQVYDKKFDDILNVIRRELGNSIDIQALMYRKLGEIVIGAFIQPNVVLSEQQIDTYLKNKKDHYALLLERLNSFHMIGILHKFTNNYKLITQCAKDIREFTKIWLGRFKNPDERLRDQNGLVYAMIDSGMPNRRIVDNINTIIQAGHGTTIWPTSRMFQELSKNPEIQQKVLQEINAVIGSDIRAPVTLNDLDEMVYLHVLIKETLRVYMPVPYLDRRLLYDMTIKNIRIPKNSVVMINYQGILKSEENYDDPEVFKPERFLKENATVKGEKTYISFGYGLKTCPGKQIAYAAIKLLIIKVIREFEICPLEKQHRIQQTAEILYKSLNGIPVVFKKRASN